jgi:hypothetical protein
VSTISSEEAAVLARISDRARPLTMADLLAEDGFTLVVCDKPLEHPDALGNRECCVHGILLSGNRFAAPENTFMVAYGAAHELAHADALLNGKGWEHTEDLWSYQAAILATWLQRVTLR